VSEKSAGGNTAERQRWLAVLARAELGELQEAWAAHGGKMAYSFLRKPEIGLVMVRGRAGGTGQPFNLGEMTVTRCAVQLTELDVVGFGYVSGRNFQQAELVAAFDALLQVPSLARRIETEVIEPLARSQQLRREKVATKVARTRVEFFTMVRGG
jgi:alpha-D-ribose 1-methylphosphonate 5-triphosphate synthase subunit PhnG